MRATIAEGLCQGHTQCHFTAPDLFGLRDEDGHAVVLQDPVPTSLEVDALLAAESCPEQAISLTEM